MDERGRRRVGPALVSIGILLVVASGASLFAHAFREVSFLVLEALTGAADPTAAAGRNRATTIAVATAGAVAAALVGHRTARRHRDRIGLTALAATARTGAPTPAVRGTLARAAGTWLASTSMVSIGRESAILEVGGTLGSHLPARTARHRGALTAAGLGAGFTAAYHAPIGAVLYVQEHLGGRRGWRAAAYTAVAVVVSHLISTRVLGADPIFPARRGGYGSLLLLGAVAVIPASIGSVGFLLVRDRVAVAARDRLPPARAVALLAVAAAVTIAAVPLAAGNGMEALRHASTHPTVGVALALGMAKLLATTAALGSGSPGGAFSPTMAVAAGWALLGFLGVELLGVSLPAEQWDGLLLAMVVGIAVGLDSPLTAALAVPEMTGDLSLVPAAALVSFGSTALVRAWTSWRATTGVEAADVLHDEDA